MCKTRHEILTSRAWFYVRLFSLETACPIVNFVKISVNWGQVVLI